MESILTALLVAGRIAATSWANVILKRLLQLRNHSPFSLFTAVWGWMTLLTIPWWLAALGQGPKFWGWVLLTCCLEVPGNVLLLRSLQHTELSIFGPLSSFKPAISLALALLLFGEVPNLMGMTGVAILLLGSILLTSQPRLADGPRDQHVSRAQRRAGVRDRLLAVLLTAAASVFLKQALNSGTQWQVLGAWCVLSWLLAKGWQIVADRQLADSLSEQASHELLSQEQTAAYEPSQDSSALPGHPGRPSRVQKRDMPSRSKDASKNRTAVIVIAFAILGMQGCTISLFARMPVGYALALFQIGSLVSVVQGHQMFGEGHLFRRLVAASVMVLGAVVIIMGT